MSDYQKNQQVQTDCCNEWRRLKKGPIELFGDEVWYPYENDSLEGQLIISDGEITCYECESERLEYNE